MATVEQKSVEASRNGGADGRTFAVDNPATGETIGHLPDMDAGQVGDLVARARVAQKGWAERTFDERAALMFRMRKWMTDDVLLVATGTGETGAALVDEADMIMFTGSTRTGKKIMARAAETLTPVSLELGGKDPMIVLRDADIERAANTAVYWGMANGGQICMSVERVYVEEPVYDEFVQKVVEKTSK